MAATTTFRPTEELMARMVGKLGEDGAHCIRERITAARQIQLRRCGRNISQLEDGALKQHCRLQVDSETLLEKAVDELGLSVRACRRILRLCRSIADLEAREKIQQHHLIEALGFRLLALDRPNQW